LQEYGFVGDEFGKRFPFEKLKPRFVFVYTNHAGDVMAILDEPSEGIKPKILDSFWVSSERAKE